MEQCKDFDDYRGNYRPRCNCVYCLNKYIDALHLKLNSMVSQESFDAQRSARRQMQDNYDYMLGVERKLLREIILLKEDRDGK
jgi:hypothetical protein